MEDAVATCALCQKEAELQLSHIVPKFVFRWHKTVSPSALRSSENPNIRVQDGLKEYLFCSDCEQLLSGWEDRFARDVFRPFQEEDTSELIVRYGDWALKFATSLSFRVLHYYKAQGLPHFSEELLKESDQALERWRLFLLGEVSHPGIYEQHLVPFDVIATHDHPNISPFMNRYITCTVDTDPVCSDSSAFIYIKLFRVLVFGHIKMERKYWKNTKLHVREGLIGGKVDYSMPDYILNYMNDKANHVSQKGGEISERQTQKIEESYEKHKEKMSNAPVTRGVLYDVMHSGNKAFRK